jgi:hypothetical protein
MKISFVGDISLNNNYIDMARKGEKPFRFINELLNKSDFVVGNLECIAEGKRTSNLPLPVLKTAVDTLEYLNDIPVSVVSLAANHVGDNYEEGFDATIDFLDKNGIIYLGASYDPKLAQKPVILEKDGITVGLLNYIGNDFKNPVPKDFKVHLNTYNQKKIIDDVRKLKLEVRFVVLLFHWGVRVEEGLFPDWYQMQDAKLFIESGADLIIGHHSHTIQPYDIFSGKYVFYSLGNFCFSNVKYDKKTLYLDKRRAYDGRIVEVNFAAKKYEVQYVHFKNRNGFLCPMRLIPLKYKFNQHIFQLIKMRAFWKLYFFLHKRIGWVLIYLFGRDKNFSSFIKDLINPSRIARGIAKLIG